MGYTGRALEKVKVICDLIQEHIELNGNYTMKIGVDHMSYGEYLMGGETIKKILNLLATQDKILRVIKKRKVLRDYTNIKIPGTNRRTPALYWNYYEIEISPKEFKKFFENGLASPIKENTFNTETGRGNIKGKTIKLKVGFDPYKIFNELCSSGFRLDRNKVLEILELTNATKSVATIDIDTCVKQIRNSTGFSKEELSNNGGNIVLTAKLKVVDS